VRHGESSFLLQTCTIPEFISNFQMHLLVEDVDAWHTHIGEQRLVERFGVKAGVPENRPWGMRDFTLVDPSGVLWRIAQKIPHNDSR
jgi:uncharacterized glyoxalase superfamily protein PhnB